MTNGNHSRWQRRGQAPLKKTIRSIELAARNAYSAPVVIQDEPSPPTVPQKAPVPSTGPGAFGLGCSLCSAMFCLLFILLMVAGDESRSHGLLVPVALTGFMALVPWAFSLLTLIANDPPRPATARANIDLHA